MYDWLMVGSGLDASYRKLLSYQTHSWEEYVKYKFCQNDQEVKNYFLDQEYFSFFVISLTVRIFMEKI